MDLSRSKGDQNRGPDALSRYPNSDPSPRDALAEHDLNDDVAPTVAYIRAVVAGTNDLLADKSRLLSLQQSRFSFNIRTNSLQDNSTS